MPVQQMKAQHTLIGPDHFQSVRDEIAVREFFRDPGELYDFINLMLERPVKEKVPHREELARRKLGAWKGKIWIAPDFDDNTEIIELFEGSKVFPDGDE